MGRLLGVELHNFKSYRGTASVGFGTSHFTSVIGPNGAGKSNMMDAISFVLGVRSSHLRSAHLKDLIYRGRMDGKDGNGSDSELENNPSEAYVMAIYERSDGEILKLQRSITTAGTSEYRINSKVVSAADYSEVLKKENILIKARNFLVFQGDVEQIASQSPQDLTRLIETISGSVEYKKEYESLKEEYEKAHEDTNGFFQRKRILNGELKQYNEQRVESEHFEKKVAEKTNLIKMYKLWQLFNCESSKNALIDKLEAKNNELKKVETKLKKEEKHFKQLNNDYSKENLAMMKQKSSVDSKNQKLDRLKKELLPYTTKRDLTMKKISDLERKIKEISIDLETQDENIRDLKKQKTFVEKAFKRFEDQKKTEEDAFDLPSDAMEEYEKLRLQFLTEGGATLLSELAEYEEEKSSITLQIESINDQKNNLMGRLSELQRNLAIFKNQAEDNQAKLNEANEELNIKKNYLNETRAKKEKLLSKEFEINTEIKEILLKLDDLTASQRESNRERRLRENVSNLQRLFPGVKGLLHDLCKPKQKKYETAVTTILGKSFDSVVVENITVAQKCIAYLKEQRAGVASFIPLDSVDSQPPSSNLRHLHANARPVLDVIEYDPVLERAMQYACGSAVVCDGLDTAKNIRWNRNIEVKIVTLDGSLIHKAGLMTGGKSKTERGWDKSQFNTLVKRKDELLDNLKLIQQQKPSEVAEKQTLNEISELESTLPLLTNTQSVIERNINDVEKEIDYQNGLLDSLNQDLDKKNRAVTENKTSLDACLNRVHTLQDKVYAAFCAQWNVLCDAYERTHGQFKRQVEQERTQFQKQLSSLENKIQFESDRLEQSEIRLKNLQGSKERFGEDLESVKTERSNIQDDIEQLEVEIEIENANIVEAENRLKSKMNKIKQIEDSVNEIRGNFEKVFKKCSDLEEDIEKNIIIKIDILRNCKIENVDVPLLEGSLESISIGENPNDLIEISEDIVIDYSHLPHKYQNTAVDDKVVDKEFSLKIQKVTEELEALSPNTKAHDRVREVQNRLKEVDENHAKTREYESSIIDRFNEIKEKRIQTFMQAFDFIANKIDSTYKELTKSDTSPLGGSAYLTLEDEEEPYNAGIKYHAMPPLKRFRDMELLSGGEKTVAALALLFAIHSYQPSPFFVLDEVDAALDNANVRRVANYIAKNAGPDFQVIVISLKNGLFERSDALVGIYREQVENSSKTMTLDLRDYSE